MKKSHLTNKSLARLKILMSAFPQDEFFTYEMAFRALKKHEDTITKSASNGFIGRLGFPSSCEKKALYYKQFITDVYPTDDELLAKVPASIMQRRKIVGEYATENFDPECGWINICYFSQENIELFNSIYLQEEGKK